MNITKELFREPAPSESIILRASGKDTSFEQLINDVALKQNILLQNNCSNQKCFVFTGRGINYWTDMLALWSIGGIAVPIPYNIEPNILKEIVKISNPQFQIASPEKYLELMPEVKTISTDIEGTKETASLRFENTSPDQTAAIVFTSGSTGRPKGVELSHASLWGNCRETSKLLQLKSTDRLMVATPFQFVSAISHFLVALNSRACFVGDETKYMQANLVQKIKDERANCFGGAPLQLRWLCEAMEEGQLSLRWVMSSGDHLNPEIVTRLKKANPDIQIQVVYGLTELGGRFCILPSSDTQHNEHTVGKPIPGLKVRIKEDDQILDHGQIGEVQVSGDYLLKGYYNDKVVTDASFDQGWFRTGDIGRLNSDGYLEILGRKDDVFKVAGQKVSLLLISDALQSLNVFEDVFVKTQEHPMFGTVPVALYVPKQPEEPFKKGPVIAALRDILPQNHIPFDFIKVESIPRTGSGKVIRKAISVPGAST